MSYRRVMAMMAGGLAVITPAPRAAFQHTTPRRLISGAAQPMTLPGLRNVFRVGRRLYSGAAPADEAGFRSLCALGVRTIISVDGATPDVAAARRHGLRYVH